RNNVSLTHLQCVLPSRLPPSSSLFPYTTLFRSVVGLEQDLVELVQQGVGDALGQAVCDALDRLDPVDRADQPRPFAAGVLDQQVDRKSTRLNSSHVKISYAVFCLEKKKR